MSAKHLTLDPQLAEWKPVEAHELVAKDFPALRNDTLLRAARGQRVAYTPVWLMRQAGRYLAEYHTPGPAGSGKPDFFVRCQDAALSCQTTLQPLVRFAVDAAIIFSDILIVPQALGRVCQMVPGRGPCFDEPLPLAAPLPQADAPAVDQFLGQMMRSLTVTRHRLGGHVPLVGFTGGPWTLFAYMVEGAPSKTWSKPRQWLYKHAERAHAWLALLTRVIIRYLVRQVHAGAQALQVFESNAGFLSREMARQFMLPYVIEIASGVKAQLARDNVDCVPMFCFPKGANYLVGELEASEYDVISVDWCGDADEMAQQFKVKPGTLSFQGNLDPCALSASHAELRVHTARMLSSFPAGRGHIANLGHGIYPDTDPAAVTVFVEAVHAFRVNEPINIGTRSSALAMAQAREVWRALTAAHPTRNFRIVKSVALGDRVTSVPIAQIGVTGAFTGELETALLNGSIDMAVHSLKDLATRMTPGTLLGAVPQRETTGDVVVLAPHLRKAGKIRSLADLPAGTRVGTSSARRAAQLARAAPQAVACDVRGNVQTRLRKLADPSNNYGALILAEAGLRRLHLTHRIDFQLDWTHAVAQAALGVQIRDGDAATSALVDSLNHRHTRLCIEAERALAKAIELGCSVPAAARATLDADNTLLLHAEFYSADGSEAMIDEEKASGVDSDEKARAVGETLANRLLKAGVAKFLKPIAREEAC